MSVSTTIDFGDIPLECRQLIYDYLLPSHRNIELPPGRPEEELFTACAALKSFSKEIEDWMYKNCRVVRLTIIPDQEFQISKAIEFDRF